ncbi:MAG TPA: ABC transporter permease [Rhizomicrobium sp.]|nr:ABC transporter permease [Rhizomicrobium sp.]
MRNTLLIARQEFIKYVTRRGFFISILMFPIWIIIVLMVPRWTSAAPQRTFTIVDRAGGYRAAIVESLARENAERDLAALASYAASNADASGLERAQQPLARWFENPQAPHAVAAFQKLGGRDAALSAMQPFLKPAARPFHPPAPRFVYVEPPPELLSSPSDRFANSARHALDSGRYFAVILIPPDFGQEGHATVQYYARDLSDSDLLDFATGALDSALHRNVLKRYAPQLVDSDALEATTTVNTFNPTKANSQSSRDDSLVKIVPIALAIILFIVSVMNASVLLQGVVEEKSNRMIEVLLSCATPRQITSGKMVGVIAVALLTIIIWSLALFGLMALADARTVTLVFDALGSVATFDTLPLLLLYFFCGLLIYGSVFLAIGSMANSLADAQSLLGPSMLILMLPNLLISGIMRDPNGEMASLVSWIPFYTPFFMMLRIASHPPALQIWGTTALALGTTAFLIWWTGRVFANHVLTTERPPSLTGLVRRALALDRRKI